MRIVVTGATGNIGTSVLDALAEDPQVDEVVAVARREPPDGVLPPRCRFVAADVATDPLEPVMAGADVVVHLAWLFQPTHEPMVTWQNNAVGSGRVFDAAAAAGVGAIVYSSSVGAYSPGDGPVDERWPTNSVPTAAYGREKAYVERLLDAIEARHPDMRVVRMRPAFVFKATSGPEQRALFAGAVLPRPLVRRGRLPAVPVPARLRFQALHSRDAGRAFAAAALGEARGAFNLAAEPVIDTAVLGDVLGTRVVEVPRLAVRTAVAAGWYLHVLPAEPALLDLFLNLPVMDATRARDELGWVPTVSAPDALRAALDGMADDATGPTPPLDPGSGTSPTG